MNPFTLTDQMADDIITTAIEGGIQYWAEVQSYRWDGQPAEIGTIATVIDHIEDNGKVLTIDRAVVRRGWRKLFTPEWKHLRDHYGEINIDPDGDHDIDSSGADNIVQLGLFGDVVYG